LILKEKIEDFLHHDYVRMVYTQNHQKSGLNFRRNWAEKSVKRAYLSKGYQSGIKRLSKRYQKVIKAVSKGYQSGINRNT
jgi:ribosome modulation factor